MQTNFMIALAAAAIGGWVNANAAAQVQAAAAFPFTYKAELYRNDEEGVAAFSLRLEQPFLAETFETSNYLRLTNLDENAYLIYPKETKFRQKHAEFYGRLRGTGVAKVRLSYETVLENLDGSRKVDVRHGDIEIAVPMEDVGPRSIYSSWADQQNLHFLDLLTYYPDETFYQYCLLQSQSRYGVAPPPLGRAVPRREELETDLYRVFSGSLAIQESLQRQTLSEGTKAGDQTIHISALSPPQIRSLNYEELLNAMRDKQHIEPQPHEVAKLIPEEQYLLHFNSMRAAGELLDLSSEWGGDVLRLVTVTARDNHLQSKLEDQLCLQRGPLTELFADGVVSELAFTGADTFLAEGTDVSLILRVRRRDAFDAAAAGWVAEVKQRWPDVVEQERNYRGHKVTVRYTIDRAVSSFVAEHGDYVIYSTSHQAVRRIIDAATGGTPALHDALDYRYVTTILPPANEEASGYLFAGESFIKRNVGPAAKISEKRRVECFNNLVMLNNASMFYRLEHGRSPETINDLIEGRFVDPRKVVCPHGGAYAYDTAGDACTCSLHNRLKLLTPNAELTVERVSATERDEYERYKQRYEAFWQQVFDPLAMRITMGQRVRLELCVLPFANGSAYGTLRAGLAERPQAIATDGIAPTAVGSLVAVVGREQIGEFLSALPGVREALEADPTLTDLTWLGDRLGIHVCDEDTVLEIDPARMTPFEMPLVGEASSMYQFVAAAGLTAAQMPVYLTIDVEDREKGRRLLDLLAAKVFLRGGDVGGLDTTLDAYRLPDYKDHAIYVLSYQLHAVKLRLHLALVGTTFVAATTPETLHQVIDASEAGAGAPPVECHLLARFNRRALHELLNDVELYGEEKSRLACHRNTISIYNLLKLYGLPVDQVGRLADAKYGVTYFCPDHGDYAYDAERDQVVCTVHGNRQQSRQKPSLDPESSFARFLNRLDEVVFRMKFAEDALLVTTDIARTTP